jgi:hypothetical protein
MLVVLHNCKDRRYEFQKAHFIASQTLLRGDASDGGAKAEVDKGVKISSIQEN